MKTLNSLLLAAGMSSIIAPTLVQAADSAKFPSKLVTIPAQLGAIVTSDIVRWQKVVTNAGITAN